MIGWVIIEDWGTIIGACSGIIIGMEADAPQPQPVVGKPMAGAPIIGAPKKELSMWPCPCMRIRVRER